MQPTPGDGRLIAGRYRLGPRLGRGGMAEVYDGFDERLARPVAVKLLRRDQARDPAMRERFEMEARSAARLNHPSVVAVYDSGEDGGDAYLVMQRLPGETLGDRMRAGPVPPGWLTGVAADVLAALQAAHAQGIVHRDVKPANILIDRDGRAKVADFGIAKAFRDEPDPTAPGDRTEPWQSDLTATGMVLGTVAYLAPEQIEGAAATPRSDLYSLGVVLYEALAGYKPFAGETPLSQARAVVEGGAPDIAVARPDVPPGLAAVVRRSMAHDPAARYASAAEMLADLEDRGGAGAADPTVVAGTAPGPIPEPTRVLPRDPPPLDDPDARRSRRLRATLIALAALVVVAAVVAVVLASEGPHRKPTTTPTSAATTSTTAAAPATTLDPEAQGLLADARQFDAIGGSGPDAVATLLTHVADTAPAGRAAAATQAARSVADLLQDGAITPAEYKEAIADLVAVGATPPATTTTTTTTTTPTTTTTTTLPAAPTTTTPTTPTTPPTPAGPGNGQGKANGNRGG